MKTCELIDKALDWAVAKCVTHNIHNIGWALGPLYPIDLSPLSSKPSKPFRPSTDWTQGGPIIEHEKISIMQNYDTGEWLATKYGQYGVKSCPSPTPLIAAMRYYVTIKLGDKIEIPMEFL